MELGTETAAGLSAQRFRALVPYGVALLLFVPFLAKPIHIDDGNFLEMARAIDPPFGTVPGYRYSFMGATTEAFNPYASTHPPGVPLYLKGVAALAGGYREIPLHLGFLVFPLLLTWAAGDLARRLGVAPALGAAAVLGSAAVLPAGQTLMADLPAAALWTAGVALLLRARDGRGRGWAAAGLAAVALAGLAAYQAALLAPLTVLLVPVRSGSGTLSSRRRVLLVSLAFALVLGVAAVLVFTGHLPFRAPLAEVSRGLTADRLVNKVVSLPLFLGLAGLPFLFWTAGEGWRRRWPLVGGLAVASCLVPFLVRQGYGTTGSAWLGLLAAAGALAAAVAARVGRGIEDRDLARLLLASIAVVTAFALLVAPFGACRYLMLLFPGFLLLLLRSVPTGRDRSAAVLVSSLLGLALAVGDYQFAASYRDFAREVAATVGPSRDRVWYVGEWGMHHYMAEAGYRYLPADSNEPQQGDLVLFAEVPRLWNPSTELAPRLELVDVREVQPHWPIHLMNQRTRVGYYSSLWGYHPFLLSREPIERFGVFRVAR